MTISTTTIKDSYTGNGSTSAFTYNFKIADDDDIQVIIRAANGTETVKTKTTHYTVSGVGNNSGTVTFTAGNIPTGTQTVILRRSTPQTQELDLIENDPLPANSIETAYDKLTQISQELQEQIDRSIKLSRTNTITSTEFTVGSVDRANKILAFDANGEIAVTQELGTYRGNWATATSYNGRDLVKDTSNNNIYIVNTAHTSSGAQPLSSNANSAYYTLIVDAATATSSATAAAASASAAASSASAASTSATNAAASASTATTQATNASTSASTASTQAGLATTAATNAATSESNAGTSATAAAASASSASSSASTATTQATNASNSATSASGSATTATTQASAASSSASAASTSATNAAASASTASTQATNAASSASAASTSASNASTSASNAATSATAAQAAQSAAEAVFDNFDDKYLGAKSVEPTLDNDNNALTDGALYYNTVSNRLKVYDLATTAWLFVAPSSADQSSINTVATNISSVQDVSNNIGSVNDFAARYRVSATAPTTSLDLGDLYFDTTSNTMKVYSSGGFINAGSSVNGTADRYKYTATASQTTFSGADDNANTLAYDAGFLDVYLNGIKLVNGSDFTASSGTSIVLTTGASASDILEVIAYGTFQLANFSIADANDVPPLGTAGQVLKVNSGATALEYGTIDLTNLNASNLTSGTLPDARFPATLPATSGANLTSLNASNLSSGTVPTARLGSGTALSSNFLRGDGTWNTPQAGFSGATITSSAVDITLTSASTQAQSVNMTAADKAVILPDATTLTTKGFPIFVIVNTGLFPFSIKNNGGYILTTCEPTSSIELTLLSNATSDGIFASDITNSVVSNNTTQSAPFNLVSLPFATIESQSVLSTNYFGYQWEVGFSMEKIDTSSFFVSYHKGTSNRDVYGRVISYSGSTITVNSETLLYNGSSAASQGASVCLTSSTTGILLVARASNCVAVPFSLSGSTITVGTTSSTFSIASSVNMPFAKPIKVTSTLIAFGERSATNTFKLRTIQYNAGSAPTIGTISSTSITMPNDETVPQISRISDTELFMAYGGAGGTEARIITISGTSAPVYNTANTTSTLFTSYLGYGSFINQIDTTNFIVYGFSGSVKYTVSGTTVTHVSDRLFTFYNSFNTSYYMMINTVFNNGDYALTHLYTLGGFYLLKKDGNHMAVKSVQTLNKSVTVGSLATAAKIIELDTNTIAVLTNNGGANVLLTTIIKYVGG